jgi:lipid A 3-O-deacylase
MTKIVLCCTAFLLLQMQSLSYAADRDLASISLGVAGIGNETGLIESRFEYRFQKKYLIFSPLLGMMVFGDGSAYIFGGFNIFEQVGKRFNVIPNFAVGGFHNGGKKDLGGALEFRSGIEIGYWVFDKLMAGIAFHHISNASIYKENPGTETLSLIISVRSRSSKKPK